MVLNISKCNYLTPLHFKGLNMSVPSNGLKAFARRPYDNFWGLVLTVSHLASPRPRTTGPRVDIVETDNSCIGGITVARPKSQRCI